MKKEDIRTVDDAEAWLCQVEELDALIDSKIIDRDDYLARATKLTSNTDGMPHASGVSDKVGNIAVKIAEISKDIDKSIDRYVDQKREILAIIELLPPKEYETLHRYYIRYESRAAIADAIHYSEIQVSRFKRRGLEHIVSMMEHLRQYGSIERVE